MNCPNEVCKPILEILRLGLGRIRVFGANGDGSRCMIESDHLHNLPGILMSYSTGAIKYYMEVERPIFLKKSGDVSTFDFESCWREIESYLETAVNSK